MKQKWLFFLLFWGLTSSLWAQEFLLRPIDLYVGHPNQSVIEIFPRSDGYFDYLGAGNNYGKAAPHNYSVVEMGRFRDNGIYRNPTWRTNQGAYDYLGGYYIGFDITRHGESWYSGLSLMPGGFRCNAFDTKAALVYGAYRYAGLSPVVKSMRFYKDHFYFLTAANEGRWQSPRGYHQLDHDTLMLLKAPADLSRFDTLQKFRLPLIQPTTLELLGDFDLDLQAGTLRFLSQHRVYHYRFDAIEIQSIQNIPEAFFGPQALSLAALDDTLFSFRPLNNHEDQISWCYGRRFLRGDSMIEDSIRYRMQHPLLKHYWLPAAYAHAVLSLADGGLIGILNLALNPSLKEYHQYLFRFDAAGHLLFLKRLMPQYKDSRVNLMRYDQKLNRLYLGGNYQKTGPSGRGKRDQPFAYILNTQGEAVVSKVAPRLYPMPFDAALKVWAPGLQSLRFRNLNGQIVWEVDWPQRAVQSLEELDTRGLPSGLYLLELIFANKASQFHKILKR